MWAEAVTVADSSYCTGNGGPGTDEEACEALVIPFPHAAQEVATKVLTITPDELCQSFTRILQAIEQGRLDPVTLDVAGFVSRASGARP